MKVQIIESDKNKFYLKLSPLDNSDFKLVTTIEIPSDKGKGMIEKYQMRLEETLPKGSKIYAIQ